MLSRQRQAYVVKARALRDRSLLDREQLLGMSSAEATQRRERELAELHRHAYAQRVEARGQHAADAASRSRFTTAGVAMVLPLPGALVSDGMKRTPGPAEVAAALAAKAEAAQG